MSKYPQQVHGLTSMRGIDLEDGKWGAEDRILSQDTEKYEGAEKWVVLPVPHAAWKILSHHVL